MPNFLNITFLIVDIVFAFSDKVFAISLVFMPFASNDIPEAP